MPENCPKCCLKSPEIAALISILPHAILSLFLYPGRLKMKEERRGSWRWSAPSGWTAEEAVVGSPSSPPRLIDEPEKEMRRKSLEFSGNKVDDEDK